MAYKRNNIEGETIDEIVRKLGLSNFSVSIIHNSPFS